MTMRRSTGRQPATSIKHVCVLPVQELYGLGARRLVLLDVLPVGCLPCQRATTADGGCNGDGNYLAELFNALLRAEMAKAASVAMPGLSYSIASLYNVLSDIIADPAMAGEIKI